LAVKLKGSFEPIKSRCDFSLQRDWVANPVPLSVLRQNEAQHAAQYGYRLLLATDYVLRVD